MPTMAVQSLLPLQLLLLLLRSANCQTSSASAATPAWNESATVESGAPAPTVGSNSKFSATQSREKTLIQRLVSRYKDVGLLGRPVVNSSDLMTIEFGLAIIQILDLDENRQLLRTNCWLRYTWRDPLLSWDGWAGSDFENITQVRLFPYDVWTPDIRLHNFADERLLEKRMARVVVYSDGTVLWIPQALFKSTCPVEIEFFPFDTQVCFLEFGSWTYDVTQLNLTWFGYEYEQFKYEPNPYVDFTNYIKSNEWYSDGQDEYRVRPSLRSRQIRSQIRCSNRTYQDSNGRMYNRTYKKLEYKIRMHRNPHFYLSILVLPCILLSCLTWVIFWLPPESPAKTQLGMNIFVAFFVLLLLLAETTPSSVRTFPLIGYFYCLNMVTITLSTFLATLVINLYIRAEKQGRLHPMLRRAMVDGLGKLFLIRQATPLAEDPQQQEQQPEEQQEQQQPEQHSRRCTGHSARSRKRQQPHQSDNAPNPRLPRMRFNKFEDYAEAQPPRLVDEAAAEVAEELSEEALAASQLNQQVLLQRRHSGLERDVREVKRYLHLYAGRLKEKERRNLAAMEWRALALVLDRVFFTLYMLAILAAVIMLIPRSHPHSADHVDPAETAGDCVPMRL